MERRVEIGCPVLEEEHIQQLEDIFSRYYQDTAQCWEMNEEGKYIRRKEADGKEPFNAQESFYSSINSTSTLF